MRRVICFGFILFLAKTASTLDCLQQIKQGDKKFSFKSSEPLKGDLKCGTLHFSVKSNELKDQNFIVYNYFPSILCGTSFNKEKIFALLPMLAKKYFDPSKIDCCEGNFCNGCDETKGISNGYYVIK